MFSKDCLTVLYSLYLTELYRTVLIFAFAILQAFPVSEQYKGICLRAVSSDMFSRIKKFQVLFLISYGQVNAMIPQKLKTVVVATEISCLGILVFFSNVRWQTGGHGWLKMAAVI